MAVGDRRVVVGRGAGAGPLAAAAVGNPQGTSPSPAIERGNADAATAPPALGADAPDFDYVSSDYLRRRLRDVLERGSVLLVFGGSDDQLRSRASDQRAARTP